MFSYGSGSIRSGARSPRKKVKLWHPSQDTVSPFLHESSERNMRRRLNSTISMDNSTQTPEKDKQQKSASPKLPASDETSIQFENLDSSASASPSQKNNEKGQSLNPKIQRNLSFEESTSNQNSIQSKNNERMTETRENIAQEPQPSTVSQVRENQIATNSQKPKRVPSMDSTTSNESNNREGRVIDNDGVTANEEVIDEHVFLKPRTSSLEVGAPKTPAHKWKINKKSSGFKLFENSVSPKKLRSRNNPPTKSSAIDNDSPWRRADQGAGEDMSWTSSLPINRHISSTSSDEDPSNVRTNQPRKKQTKGSSTKGETSCSSDNSSKQQRFYLREEEITILNFIIHHKAFSQVKGNRLWKLMEATQVLNDRSSQSMKERFRRHIFPKLSKYEHLSKTDIDNFKNPPKEEIENTSSKTVSQNSTSPAAQQNTSIQVGSESTTEDEGSKDDDNVSVASESNRSTTSIVSGIRQSRNYTMAEEIKILNFIVTKRRFSEVNGNSLWQLMETKKVVENRSWQSMKERFRRHIGPNLNRYESLTSKEINQFNKYLSAVSKQIKKKSK